MSGSSPTAEALIKGLTAAVSRPEPRAEGEGLQATTVEPEGDVNGVEELQPTPVIQNHPLAGKSQAVSKESNRERALLEGMQGNQDSR